MSDDATAEFKLPTLPRPREWPFHNVHWRWKCVMFLPPLLVACAVYTIVYGYGRLVYWPISILSIPLLYVWVYVSFLGIPVRETSRPFSLAVALFLLCAVLIPHADLVSTALVLALLYYELYIITYGTIRYKASPAPYYLQDTIKHMYHWARYRHPGILELALLSTVVMTAALTHRLAPAAGLLAVCILTNEFRYVFGISYRQEKMKLDDHFVDVLKAQATAQGLSVAAFAQRYLGAFVPNNLNVHRGEEDENGVEKETYTWEGCTKDSIPCFLHNYVDFCGINTPPCCREHMVEMANDVMSCLQECNIDQVWIDGGSLLGPVRHNGDIIPWEDDIDLGYLADENIVRGSELATRLESLIEAKGYTVTVHPDNGNVHVLYSRPQSWLLKNEILRREPWRALHLDLVPFRAVSMGGMKMLMRKTLGQVDGRTVECDFPVAREYVLPLSTIELRGRMLPCPRNPDKYLTTLYDDWKTVNYTYLQYEQIAQVRKSVDARYFDVGDDAAVIDSDSESETEGNPGTFHDKDKDKGDSSIRKRK